MSDAGMAGAAGVMPMAAGNTPGKATRGAAILSKAGGRGSRKKGRGRRKGRRR